MVFRTSVTLGSAASISSAKNNPPCLALMVRQASMYPVGVCRPKSHDSEVPDVKLMVLKSTPSPSATWKASCVFPHPAGPTRQTFSPMATSFKTCGRYGFIIFERGRKVPSGISIFMMFRLTLARSFLRSLTASVFMRPTFSMMAVASSSTLLMALVMAASASLSACS